MRNNLKKITFTLSIIFLPQIIISQELVRFSVDAGQYNRSHCPIYVDLSKTDYQSSKNNLSLYRIQNSELLKINFQFDNKDKSVLWFIPEGSFPENTTREYVLKYCNERSVQATISMKVNKDEESITLNRDGKMILKYQTATVNPPEGVDTAYQRSGFIHPVWSPAGEILTRIQPPDHYHHYGIWGPWTRTHIGDREIDFWNLVKKLGTVRYAGLSETIEGDIFCQFKVKQEHIDFGASNDNQVAIKEELTVRAWNVGDSAWMIDYTTEQSTPLESGIILNAYRYGGGLGFRATERWTNKNSTVLTSEGKTRKNADRTKARWCRIEGESSAGRSGIVFMDYPQNREFPEPTRVWPINANHNRGDLFFEFCPIRHKSWELAKGEKHILRYRMFIFDGQASSSEAEALWQAFANPPRVIMKK